MHDSKQTKTCQGSQMTLNILDLFSGIGGFSYAFEQSVCKQTGRTFRTVGFCEQDKFCQSILRKHWPDVPIYDDVRTIPTGGLGRIDLICGGFPCQPWSSAGRHKGANDDRDLWPEMARLIEQLQPTWVVGENVSGFINKPMGLRRSLSDLANRGYATVPFEIPACATKALHIRNRVWILGYSDSAYSQRKRLPSRVESEISITDSRSTRGNISENVADTNINRTERNQPKDGQGGRTQQSNQDVADTNVQRRQGSGELVATINSTEKTYRQAVEFRDGCKHGQGCSESRLGRVPDGVPDWMDEPDIPKVKKGRSVRGQRERLKALGNAVVPQVVMQIAKAILEAERLTETTE